MKLPTYHGTTPGQPAAEDRKADELVWLDAPIPGSFIQGNCAGSGRNIAVLVDRDIKSFHGDVQVL